MSSDGISWRVDMTKLNDLIREVPDKVEDFLSEEAEDMVNNIKLSFGTSPSMPGEPPGVDTGALRVSMRWEHAGPFTRHIMDGVEYGKWLELGTENEEGGQRMAPRPFVGPEFEAERQRIGRRAAERLNIE